MTPKNIPKDYLSVFSKKLGKDYSVDHLLSANKDSITIMIRSKQNHKKYLLKVTGSHKSSFLFQKKNNETPAPIYTRREANLYFRIYPSNQNAKENSFSPPKIPTYLYVLFIICGFCFLFSLHHFLTHKNQTEKNNPLEGLSHMQIKEKNVSTKGAVILTTPSSSSSCAAIQSSNEKNFLAITNKKYSEKDILKKIKQNPNATVLVASGNQLTTIKNLPALPQLKELYLSENKLHSLHTISRYTNITTLVLSQNNLTNLTELSKLTQLTFLDISYNPKIVSIRCLASLKQLQYLILHDSGCSQKEIQYLQKKLPLCTIL